MIARGAAALLLAAVVALVAWRGGWLSRSGAIAATAVGASASAAGWPWITLLLVFFLSSGALSRFRIHIKMARIAGMIAKGGPRDAWQVLANGAAFAVAAIAALVSSSEPWAAAGAGALAAAAADTWATEIGTLARGMPRLVTTWKHVPTGTSGAVSLPGTIAMLGGAAVIAACARLVGWPAETAVAAAAGGVSGSLADSMAGALAQARRRCASCDASTERMVHDCGMPTVLTGGFGWLNNDGVNLLGSVTGALVALGVWFALR